MSKVISKSAIDWSKVQRVLVVRLRSIGDTVLSTPSLIALKRFLPDAQIDVLLEDWVAPVLDGFDAVDNVLTVSRNDKKSRLETALKIRRNKYDVAFNLHGGTTATLFVRASGAKYRVGFASYQYNFLYTHLAPSPLEFWKTVHAHSAEQQLALLGFVGVPVEDKPKSRLTVTQKEKAEIDLFLHVYGIDEEKIALIHPVAAFDTKQWATENFAKIIDYLASSGIFSVVVATPKEENVMKELSEITSAIFHGFTDLTLPEITALASKAKIFIGNDSGIAHIAAAVNTPSVVIFGSSNINHWRPWTNAPHEIVYEKMPCQPCAGYFCKEFAEPECIKRVSVESVIEAMEKVLVDKTNDEKLN
ncbi:MAG: glycosyltransferase family 9 protein [Pyrinomonadaceae bacterium]|nr:glycosyltransferase family 9 protein [Pyrinomonadaceae bacterium]